jgi:imidazolonepropionase-like amidohydrolase
VLMSAAVVAFRAVGLIIASVANSSQESQILIQLVYLPMLLTSVTFSISVLPGWLEILGHFLPASYLVTGVEAILVRGETLAHNLTAFFALLLSTGVATLISSKLFRWEKEERINTSAKLWLLAVIFPFLVLGGYQAYTRDHLAKAQSIYRQLQRERTVLIRNARIFIGDGKVIDSGAVLIRNGKIAEIFEGAAPEPDLLKAEVMEANGKTVLPGLIDADVHLALPGAPYKPGPGSGAQAMMERELAAHLYCGVTTVRSSGDPLDLVLKVRASVNGGERLGAELFASGPVFTAVNGNGTQYFRFLPPSLQSTAEREFVRTPGNPEEAARQVVDLARAGVDGIAAILDTGSAPLLFDRMDTVILNAIVSAANARGLAVTVQTGDARDVMAASEAGAGGITRGSWREIIPAAVFAGIVKRGCAYEPELGMTEAASDFLAGNTGRLDRSLVQQASPPALLAGARAALQSRTSSKGELPSAAHNLQLARENLISAYRSGVRLAAGSGAGTPFVFHGPSLHRELQLWVAAGIPARVVLQAATYNAAQVLRAGSRIGAVRKGYDADLLIVDGNPLEDISTTERISAVIFKGERINRSALFEQE